MHGAGKVRRGGKMPGRAEQHGGVAVVTAGMHLVGDRRGVVEFVLLLQVQRIHVGAQADRLLPRLPALQGADHAGGGEPAMDLDAPRLQLVGDDLRGPLLLEGRLGMAMDVAADGGEFGSQAGELGRGDMSHGGETSRRRRALP